MSKCVPTEVNDLNSLLLEGKVVKDLKPSCTLEGIMACTFALDTHRYFREGEEIKEEVSRFTVVVRGHLAEVCGKYLTKGRAIRLVGRLKSEDGRIYIVAEHVEYRSVKKEAEV